MGSARLCLDGNSGILWQLAATTRSLLGSSRCLPWPNTVILNRIATLLGCIASVLFLALAIQWHYERAEHVDGGRGGSSHCCYSTSLGIGGTVAVGFGGVVGIVLVGLVIVTGIRWQNSEMRFIHVPLCIAVTLSAGLNLASAFDHEIWTKHFRYVLLIIEILNTLGLCAEALLAFSVWHKRRLARAFFVLERPPPGTVASILLFFLEAH